ncbi:guanylate kinase-like isoform X2 [Corticium candelabrum]|uniref:guanylate kinase-like isoform X2 n=1 Tax=Corticium candelabrum TaxID=121492 RepID=UPI002E254A7C|nr:guanylate kinase-like isoform X2 [Corticium candelabrum]
MGTAGSCTRPSVIEDVQVNSIRKRSLSKMSTEGKRQGEHSKFVPRPLVVAGPSGSGKSTLLKQLFDEFPQSFGFSVSHTTRKPRPGEVNGKEYHFVTRDVMEKEIAEGNFIESAEFSSNLYGTSKKAVMDVSSSGRICVLDIDMQGVRSVKQTDLNAVYVLVKPPSMEVLEERLRGRQTDSEEAVQQRLKAAKGELDYATQPGVFDHVVVNDTVDGAYRELRAIVIQDIEKLKAEC